MFLKRLIKYFYFHFVSKNKVNIHFLSHIDFKSVFGKNCTLEKGSRVSKSKIGDDVFLNVGAAVKESTIANNVSFHANSITAFCNINSFTYLAKNAVIYNATIGKYCSIGPEVWIGLGRHPSNFLSTNPIFYSTSKVQLAFTFTEKQMYEEYNNCTIGNDVWIGARAIILDGVSIGDGAIVAANSVVTKNVEAYSIVGGSPAKHIKYRFNAKKIAEIQNMNWWDWSIEKIKSSIGLFQKEIIDEL